VIIMLADGSPSLGRDDSPSPWLSVACNL